jgi:hypothetical protein
VKLLRRSPEMQFVEDREEIADVPKGDSMGGAQRCFL